MEWIALAGTLIVFGWLLLCRLEPDAESAFGRLLRRYKVHRVQVWFCRRFSREERFGLTLTIGLIISLLAGVSFGELADEILEQELLTELDLVFGEGLLGLASETTTRFFFWITQLANPIVLLIGVTMAGLWLIPRGRNTEMFVLLAAVGGGELINQALKLLFSRPRPNFLDLFTQELGFSFPSGHAMMSVVFYGILAYLIGRRLRSDAARLALIAAAAIVALMVGFSRLVLGVHYLSDVLGGWAAGIAWLAACITASEVRRADRSTAPPLRG